ncbi:hypothetical protein Spb1_01500 [Planctopirus ephydatiae]|uniref:Uncharacterized protein n=1 Tax=Planctopirus ephydatiae TaxID=2528019 RepID=A0A518GI65_9PLAN|nr:hypothetical protein [Planctopirus ephydatiae]QDV28287.1 hypothetical protein Spb1_01500 [Planctopirus ephydatiae]
MPALAFTDLVSTDLLLMFHDWGQPAQLLAVLETSPHEPPSRTWLIIPDAPLIVLPDHTLARQPTSSPQGTLSAVTPETRFFVRASAWPVLPKGALLELSTPHSHWAVTQIHPLPDSELLVISARALAPAD